MNHDNYLPKLPWKEVDGKLYDSTGNLIAEGNVAALRYAARASRKDQDFFDFPFPYQGAFG